MRSTRECDVVTRFSLSPATTKEDSMELLSFICKGFGSKEREALRRTWNMAVFQLC